MDTILPPLPPDLWPHTHPAGGSRPQGRMLALEIPGMSESLLLGVLARAIHHEMRTAGEWAARIASEADKDFPSAKDFARFRAENAARLLTLYAALFASSQYVSTSDITPEALKAAASKSYQFALRDERAKQQTFSPGYNHAVYQTEKAAALTPSSHRR
jgi:hypothetical protein